MKEYAGSLKTLGPSTSSSGGRKFSFIEIGSDRIKSVGISHALGGILDEAIRHGQPIKIWVVSYFGRKIIAGVSRADGTVFRSKMTGIVPAVILAGVGIALTMNGQTGFMWMGFALLAWVAYFANINRKLFSIPADDSL